MWKNTSSPLPVLMKPKPLSVRRLIVPSAMFTIPERVVLRPSPRLHCLGRDRRRTFLQQVGRIVKGKFQLFRVFPGLVIQRTPNRREDIGKQAILRAMRFVAFLAVAALAALSGCIVQSNPQAEQDFRMQVPGRYLAEVDGQQAELILNADGTGSLNGVQGQWQIQAGMLMLSDGQQ